MPKYLIIQDNTIVNIIPADSKEDAELLTRSTCIEQDESLPLAIGQFFNGTSWYGPSDNLEAEGE